MRISFSRCCLSALLVCALLCLYGWSPSYAADPKASVPALTVAEKGASITWRPYEIGLAIAKSENKKIFLHFYTNRCHYCKMMASKTFPDQRVIDLLNDKFICIKVNLGEKPALASTYPVRGVPTSWFLESNGDKIGVKPGYLSPDQFLPMLKFVINEEYKQYNGGNQ